MDLRFGPQYEAFRDQVRAFLASHKDSAPPASVRSDLEAVLDWQKVLVENGYAARTISRKYGGFGAEPDLLETMIIEEEFSRARVSRGIENQGISMFVPTLLRYGTEEQKQRYIPATIRGEMIWCQGYSEPGAGSDLASLRTTAHLEGDEFVVNGQKIWTTTAREAHMMFALVRAEPEASKHAGISYLVLSMESPGIKVRPLQTMTGDSSFNEVFFSNVRVPRENLIGERGQGWEVGTYTLRHERSMLGRSEQTETLLRNCLDVLRDTGSLDDPVYRERLTRIQARTLAMKYHSLRVLTDHLKGRPPGLSGLITKLNGCQLNYDICALAIDALGQYGVLEAGSKHARDEGAWQHQYMYSLGLIIGGGTAQIQKNIIAEVGLGMPREPKPQN